MRALDLNASTFPAPHRVTPGQNGSLLGTTLRGGIFDHCDSGCGTFYQLNPPSQAGGSWTEEILFDFLAADKQPTGLPVSFGGAWFGTASGGGNTECTGGCGSIYKLQPPTQAGESWTITTIFEFAPDIGITPNSPLAVDGSGVLYGTARFGGNVDVCGGCGTVFSLTPPIAPATQWTFQDIYRFHGGDDGYWPWSGLLVGPDGTLYGTTLYGGSDNRGTVFSLTSPGTAGGFWTENILYTFHGAGGESPNSYAGNLAFGPDGSLYGAAPGGGGAGSCDYFGCGILYQLTPPAVIGGSWTETILHAFSGLADGTGPIFAPAVDVNGVLYGVAFGGVGSACDEIGCGVVYQYIPVHP